MFGNLPGIVIVLAWLRRYDWKRCGADAIAASLKKTAPSVARLRGFFDLWQQQILAVPSAAVAKPAPGNVPAFPTSNREMILSFRSVEEFLHA